MGFAQKVYDFSGKSVWFFSCRGVDDSDEMAVFESMVPMKWAISAFGNRWNRWGGSFCKLFAYRVRAHKFIIAQVFNNEYV